MEPNRDVHQEALKLMNKVFGNLLGRSPSYKYFSKWNAANASRAKDRFCYSSEKVTYKGKPRYTSWVYRYNASKKQWVMRYEAGHAKKKDAIERARKMSKA